MAGLFSLFSFCVLYNVLICSLYGSKANSKQQGYPVKKKTITKGPFLNQAIAVIWVRDSSGYLMGKGMRAALFAHEV
jgi:hypothetical protein